MTESAEKSQYRSWRWEENTVSIAVSVVIPVYNTARYLNQCVDSLIGQTLKEVEFIFVDDGSTDDSVNILEQYQKKDGRIKILRQKNQFAGVARNHGMEEASGKYIIFVDSDDFFEPNMLRDSYRTAEKNQAEIVMFGFRKYDESLHAFKGQSLLWGRQLPKGVFSAADMGNDFYWKYPAFPWNKLFLRSFVEAHHLRFEAVKKCNDAYFVCMAMALAERIKFTNHCYVNYRIGNQNSLQGARNLGRESFVDCCISLKKGLLDAGKYEGNIRQSAVRMALGNVNLGLEPPYTKEALSAFYRHTKEHLIPDLFDSASDFDKSFTVKNIYESTDFSDFLFRQLQSEKSDKQTNYVPVSDPKVRVGGSFLALPLKILRFIKR